MSLTRKEMFEHIQFIQEILNSNPAFFRGEKGQEFLFALVKGKPLSSDEVLPVQYMELRAFLSEDDKEIQKLTAMAIGLWLLSRTENGKLAADKFTHSGNNEVVVDIDFCLEDICSPVNEHLLTDGEFQALCVVIANAPTHRLSFWELEDDERMISLALAIARSSIKKVSVKNLGKTATVGIDFLLTIAGGPQLERLDLSLFQLSRFSQAGVSNFFAAVNRSGLRNILLDLDGKGENWLLEEIMTFLRNNSEISTLTLRNIEELTPDKKRELLNAINKERVTAFGFFDMQEETGTIPFLHEVLDTLNLTSLRLHGLKLNRDHLEDFVAFCEHAEKKGVSLELSISGLKDYLPEQFQVVCDAIANSKNIKLKDASQLAIWQLLAFTQRKNAASTLLLDLTDFDARVWSMPADSSGQEIDEFDFLFAFSTSDSKKKSEVTTLRFPSIGAVCSASRFGNLCSAVRTLPFTNLDLEGNALTDFSPLQLNLFFQAAASMTSLNMVRTCFGNLAGEAFSEFFKMFAKLRLRSLKLSTADLETSHLEQEPLEALQLALDASPLEHLEFTSSATPLMGSTFICYLMCLDKLKHLTWQGAPSLNPSQSWNIISEIKNTRLESFDINLLDFELSGQELDALATLVEALPKLGTLAGAVSILVNEFAKLVGIIKSVNNNFSLTSFGNSHSLAYQKLSPLLVHALKRNQAILSTKNMALRILDEVQDESAASSMTTHKLARLLKMFEHRFTKAQTLTADAIDSREARAAKRDMSPTTHLNFLQCVFLRYFVQGELSALPKIRSFAELTTLTQNLNPLVDRVSQSLATQEPHDKDLTFILGLIQSARRDVISAPLDVSTAEMRPLSAFPERPTVDASAPQIGSTHAPGMY